MMPEIGAAVGGLKVAVDLVRGITAADKAINEAELKMKLLSAVNEMISARQALMDAEGEINRRDAEIERLNDALQIKNSVVRAGSAYFDVDVNTGQAIGDGYCIRCYEVDHRLYHLAYGRQMMNDKVICPACKTDYVYAGVHPR